MKLAFALLLCSLAGFIRAGETRIYYATYSEIRSTALDGSDTRVLRSGLDDITAFDMFPGTNYFYYGRYQPDVGYSIYRGSILGTTDELLVADTGAIVYDFGFDTLRGHLYWTQWDWGFDTTTGLYRSNPDGQDIEWVEPLLTAGLEVDPTANKLYACKLPQEGYYEPNDLVSANLDGSNPTLLHGLPALWFRQVRKNKTDGKLYLTFQAIDTVWFQRINVDGTGFEDVPIDYDMGQFDFGPSGKIYGAAYYYQTQTQDLVSFESDGSDYTVLQTGLPWIVGLAVRAEAPTVPVLTSVGLFALLVLLGACGLWWSRGSRGRTVAAPRS